MDIDDGQKVIEIMGNTACQSAQWLPSSVTGEAAPPASFAL